MWPTAVVIASALTIVVPTAVRAQAVMTTNGVVSVATAQPSPAEESGDTTTVVVNPPGVPVLTDFQLRAAIDTPQQLTFVSRAQGLIIGGWCFECRSGLQPASQRVGDIGVRFINVNTRQAFLPVAVQQYTSATARPDVRAAYQASCPALGANAGYSLVVTGLPPPNMYQMEVVYDTFDYAGRTIIVTIRRTVIITD